MNTVASPLSTQRRFPIGVEVLGAGAASFRVWAPRCERVAVVIGQQPCREVILAQESNGYFAGTVSDVVPGTLYRYRLDGGETLQPDPASRSQPQGHDGPSALVDPSCYAWTDDAWKGVALKGQVIYEMHIGTYTKEGTWRAAARELPWLANLGVTLLEVMPVGEFPGRYGWGYDVVHFFAPTHLYGTPDDMRAFVDRAHALGMGVILDVVYNHCASVGNFLDRYACEYFTDRHENEWGNAFNFDGPRALPVREFILTNVEYWIREFRLDGFRLDATQTIFDASPTHIIAEIGERARLAAGDRRVVVIAENEPQHVELTAPVAKGGYGLDALWNDDLHHSARVAMTGRREAYYVDYRGTPQELVSAVKRGFLYQGQYYTWQKKARGTPALGTDPARFVVFLQNHDQVANSTRGLRIHELADPGCVRACTALMLLAPGTPMLFQGQEFAASTPFLYFADNEPDTAAVVKQGRQDFLSQFRSVAAGGHVCMRDPSALSTFERCKLDLDERGTHAAAVALHRDLLRLRRDDPVFSAQREGRVDGALLGGEAFVLRFFGGGEEEGDRLLIVNLGAQLDYTPMPEPLLAPPRLRHWRLTWSSEDVRYGGDGTPHPCIDGSWQIPAHAALVLAPAREE